MGGRLPAFIRAVLEHSNARIPSAASGPPIPVRLFPGRISAAGRKWDHAGGINIYNLVLSGSSRNME
ncbi:hypothetical protein PSTEL_26250 [Paenibacillus stellifer]|uniref:Uncharacterized protein n=1 Tax=Paenibacillus stellifer TaxID=169760 RepID=A0A089NB52_9BACL|nr:hypothetical protein PSTEL_26250 [Paenibacillus stellifer]